MEVKIDYINEMVGNGVHSELVVKLKGFFAPGDLELMVDTGHGTRVASTDSVYYQSYMQGKLIQFFPVNQCDYVKYRKV